MILKHLVSDNLDRLEDDLGRIKAPFILHSIVPRGNAWVAFIIMQEITRGLPEVKVQYAEKTKTIKVKEKIK